MYQHMTSEQVYDFINSGTITAHLATVREDERPHVAPIWIATDGEDIVWNTGEDSVKGRNLMRTRYAAISLDDSVAPYNSVRIEGAVELIEDMEQVRHWATIIGGKYMGADMAEVFGARNGVPGELLCRMTPSRISGIIGVADFHTGDAN